MERTQRESLEFESLVLEAVSNPQSPGTAHVSNVKSPTDTQCERIVTTERSRESLPKSNSRQSARATEMVGHWIGPYHIVEWIDDRGAETVYRATGGEVFAHDVAIKLLN